MAIFTQNESINHQNAVSAFLADHGAVIEQGAIEEFHQYADRFMAAKRNHQTAVVKEIASWRIREVLDEVDFVGKRVDQALGAAAGHLNTDAGADVLADLRGIYAEYAGSGDKAKARAAAESFKGLLSKIPGDAPMELRMAINQMGKKASQDLAELRTTPEMVQSAEAAQAAADALMKQPAQLAEVGALLSGQLPGENPLETRAMYDALKRLQTGDNGGIKVLPREVKNE